MKQRSKFIGTTLALSTAAIIGAKLLGEFRPDERDCQNRNLKGTLNDITTGSGFEKIEITTSHIRIYSDLITQESNYDGNTENETVKFIRDTIDKSISTYIYNSGIPRENEISYNLSGIRVFCSLALTDNEISHGIDVPIWIDGNLRFLQILIYSEDHDHEKGLVYLTSTDTANGNRAYRISDVIDIDKVRTNIISLLKLEQ